MELEKYGTASSSALNSWVLGGKTGLEWVDRGGCLLEMYDMRFVGILWSAVLLAWLRFR